MKDTFIDIIIMIGVSLGLISIICFFIFCSYFGSIKAITSSPVEEIYHRQLVNTIDSILNARCNEEVIDSDDVSIPSSMFSSRNSINIAK